jgi:Ca2+/Na+ antiporter
MEYSFSWGWFFGGLAIIVVSVIFMRFYQWIADNFGAGVADYERYKLFGLIAIGVGLLSMINVLPLLLMLILSQIFGAPRGN